MVTLYEAKTQLSQLLRDVENGMAITITRHGKPVAELSACGSAVKHAKRGCGKSHGFFMAADFDAPLEMFDEYLPRLEVKYSDELKVAEKPPRRGVRH